MTRMALVAASLMLASCSSLDQFDVELTSSGVIRGMLGRLPDGFGHIPAGAEVKQTIRNQGVKPEDITSARLTQGSIRVKSPENGHLSFLPRFEIWVESPGLERKRVAYQDEAFAERRSSYPLVIEDVDLKPYVTAAEMTLVPNIDPPTRPPQHDHEIEVSLTLNVDLSLLK